ncbi:MAG: DNA replication/repair protein RecF [Gammaproteobacteria bacterium]|nr:DNA replication/repair protein RecF [Gammaproteobacteria bacterium]
MSLTRLHVKHLRNLQSVDIQPVDGLNLVVGENASGKTSLLEAIYLLGMGRSFRSINIRHVIQQGEHSLIVFGAVNGHSGTPTKLGVEKQRDKTRIKIDGEWIKNSAQLAYHLPLLMVTPDSHKLIEQGPRYRRQFIDWGVFHVEHAFHPNWQRFQRALKQRNAAIKQGLSYSSVEVWNRELAQWVDIIDKMRKDYVQELLPIAHKNISQLTDINDIQMDYQQGWKQGSGYFDYLRLHHEQDRESGYTRYGPHRAELSIRVSGMPAAERVSRGQQKLLACALRLAQVEHLKQRRDVNSVLMVDDLPAELDSERRGRFLEMLRQLETQVFVTATESSLISNRESWNRIKMFHVEHGRVTEVV